MSVIALLIEKEAARRGWQNYTIETGYKQFHLLESFNIEQDQSGFAVIENVAYFSEGTALRINLRDKSNIYVLSQDKDTFINAMTVYTDIGKNEWVNIKLNQVVNYPLNIYAPNPSWRFHVTVLYYRVFPI